MKLNYLQTIATTSLALAMTTIGCSKGGGGSSPQPQNGDPFLQSWKDTNGNFLDISTKSVVPGYAYRAQYMPPGPAIYIVDEPCQYSNNTSLTTTLTCDYKSKEQPDTLVYNAANTTITFTIQFPTQRVITFYPDGKVPPDPAADFLHTFTNGAANFITIAPGAPYEIKCAYNGATPVPVSEVENLTFSTLAWNIEEVIGVNLSGKQDFHAIYDITNKTLTTAPSEDYAICGIPNETIFNLGQ